MTIPDLNEHEPAFDLVMPDGASSPLVFASPHSGRHCPQDFRRATRLDALGLRRSEDCYVDELFADAPSCGAVLLAARFPRAWVDVNREPYELDPLLFAEPLPVFANSTSERVRAGLGTIPRLVGSGMPIHAAPLPLAEAEKRLAIGYRPYHAELARLLHRARQLHGHSILIDCHSMPARALPGDFPPGAEGANPDIVLGDRHGESCHPLLIDAAEACLAAMGYRVVRNRPYAGGYCTLRHGRPARAMHALQIEINRGLYVDEASFAKLPGFARVRADMAKLAARLAALDLAPPARLAAE